MQFPLVDGEVWWKYIAKNTTHWRDDVADPVNIMRVLKELQKLYVVENQDEDSMPISRFIKIKGMCHPFSSPFLA